jgi:heme-degrading monooxygenase HmoA
VQVSDTELSGGQMIVVIFEIIPKVERKTEYLAIAAYLRKQLTDTSGFISIEPFQSLTDHNKQLSLSFWKDEASVKQWQNLEDHRYAQSEGRDSLFSDYRIRVGNIIRDYSLSERHQVPKDHKDTQKKQSN